MSGILGGLIFAGVFAAALSGGESWNDEVGARFSNETNYVIENGHKNAEIILGAVSDNANGLKSEAQDISIRVQSEISGYNYQAKSISEKVCALNPKQLYDASIAYMNTVK